jgi:subtilisin family serine protease
MVGMTARATHLLTLASLCCAALAAPPQAAADGTIVVRTSKGVSQRRLASAGVTSTIRVIAGTGARLVRVNGDPAAVAARLDHARGIVWAEPNFRMHALAGAIPNDSLWGELYGVRRIGAPAYWSAHGLRGFPGSGGVPVGIVDTGIDAGHEDLAGRVGACGSAAQGLVTDGDCSDGEGHGTHVAGTIGAIADNRLGIAGIAFAAPLIVCRALGADGSGTVADIAACMRWTRDKGAKVISMSVGGPPSETIAAAAKTAYARGGRAGSLIVAAAGNDGDATISYPAGLPQVVSVAAVGPTDAVAPFSNENADVELAAAGVDVLSTKRGGGYVRSSGTSMATPHVSAAAALLWGADTSATAARIRAKLDAAVDDLGAPGRDPAYGFGILNLAKVP